MKQKSEEHLGSGDGGCEEDLGSGDGGREEDSGTGDGGGEEDLGSGDGFGEEDLGTGDFGRMSKNQNGPCPGTRRHLSIPGAESFPRS